MDKIINDIINNYLLRETIENEDYPLYHRCGLSKLYQILKDNRVDSRRWDGYYCISCTRNKSFVVGNTSSKYVNITFNINKLKAHNRDIYIRNFSWKRKSDEFYEYEERICSRKGKDDFFTIPNIDECIDRIDLLIDHWDYNDRREEWNEIFDLLKRSSLYNKTFFTTSQKEWDKGITRNSYPISQYDVIEKGITDSQRNYDINIYDRGDNLDYINSIYDDSDLEAQIQGLSFDKLHKYFQFVQYNEEYDCIIVVKDEKYNLLSYPNNKLLLPFWAEEIDAFNEDGLARIMKDNKFNLTNNKGQLLSREWLDSISSRSRCGFYRVEYNNRYNFMSVNGKILLNQWYDFASNFKDGYARISTDDYKENIIDINGNILSPDLWFDDARAFRGDFATVGLQGKYNFMGKDGKLLSPNQWFDEVENDFNFLDYSEVHLKGRIFIIDKNGTLTKKQ